MVAAVAEKPKKTAPKVSKTGKVRTSINGKIAWVYPDELTLAAPQAAAAQEFAGADLVDWDGNEVEEFEEDYEDYLASRPPRSELRPYAEPVLYWEPTDPGCSLMPYPRMGAIMSSITGIWTANNAAQEKAIRAHITKRAKVDPDLLKVSPQEWDTMQGRGNDVMRMGLRYCHAGGCRWVSCSALANHIHEVERGHDEIKTTPREN